MNFLSLPFLALMIFVVTLYFAKSDRRWQHSVLIVANMTFIGYYHISYLIVSVLVTLFTFIVGKQIGQTVENRKSSYWLWTGIVGLIVFWLAARYWSPIFPLGISFYVFQAVSYLLDIYWGEDPEDDLVDFSLYMMFFVKFLSGPIERSYNFLPQLKTHKVFNYEAAVSGSKVFVWGMFLKLVIADRIAPSLDIVFSDVYTASGMQLLFSTLLYPIQLYADFAGYTCMAIGLGRILGFQLAPNFNRPFLAQSTSDLWRRWHISLSSWVRDYVFTPLSAELRLLRKYGIYISLLITFVVIGVWHGAGLSFALYGLFQGILVIYETAGKKMRGRIKSFLGTRMWTVVSILRTYLFFALSLLFFRLPHAVDTFHVYAHLFDGFNTDIKELRLGISDNNWLVFFLSVFMMFLIEWLNGRINLIGYSKMLRAPLRWIVYFMIICFIFMFGAFGVQDFIYTGF
ncbi:MAG: MBOAT family O-acyltransferase [Prevotella sp.]